MELEYKAQRLIAQPVRVVSSLSRVGWPSNSSPAVGTSSRLIRLSRVLLPELTA